MTSYEWLTALVVLLPLVSFVLCLLFSDQYSWVITIMASLLLLVSACISVYLFFSWPSETLAVHVEWFRINQFVFNANLELNRFSIMMLPLVTIISFLVHVYSIGYMAGDTGIRRYFAMLGFFTFSMLGIVLSDNLLLIFIFWELVGFSSYILIGHWLQKPQAARAAKKAFLFNRIGDAGFLVGIMIVWSNTQSLALHDILYLSEESWKTAASLCMFCGVIGKSAQLPLFSWLPDAMEGPTPVSALIHAATMVAAGVFLLARIFPLFTPDVLMVVALVGTSTALAAAISALHQFDIKKILAYSTISQLGIMVAAVGVQSENAAMAHLFAHAFFKAGLFLAAGSVIHVLHQSQQQTHRTFDVQDIRNLGGLRKQMPFTFTVFVLTGASLAGIPFFSGFLSKEAILTSAWSWSGHSVSWKWLIVVCLFAISFITVLYTFRMIWYVFMAKEKHSILVNESPWIMRIPMGVLAIASCWFLLSWNPFGLSGWFHFTENLPHITFVTLLASGVVLIALITAWYRYASQENSIQSNSFIRQGYKLDVLYNNVFGKSALKIAAASETADRKWIDGLLHFTAYANVSVAHVIAWFDQYIIDGFVDATAWLAKQVGSFTRSFQGGKIQLYIFWALAGLIIFLFFLLI